jgi:hypothetical protein
VSLVNARLELHYAAQIVSAAGSTLIPAKEDASHTNLGWKDGALHGHRAALRFADLAIVAGDDVLPLAGKTLDEGTQWLADRLDVATLTRPLHDLPAHPIATGAAFTGDDAPARGEIAQWVAMADAVLRTIASENEPASPVRLWPHHFDIATLLSLGESRTIGVGLSTGDASYDEPYFYVTPWPYPERGLTLPSLPAGHWHVKGWTGAVLLGSELARNASQELAALEMLRAAIAGSRVILGESGVL